MKKYIGTKVVAAEPMTRVEAEKILDRAIKSATGEDDGYLVQYEDGYKSWSPKTTFEAAYRLSETVLDRMNVEYKDLCEKLWKSNAFLDSSKFNELPYVPKTLLAAQHFTMVQYSHILFDRIEAMSGYSPKLGYFDFGTAINFLLYGGAVRRTGWKNKLDFVVKQIPATVTEEIIPNMQSLPVIAKNIVLKRPERHISYTNQMLIIRQDGKADSWLPNAEDVFAADWCLVTD